MLLDEILPQPRWRESHRIATDAPSHELLRAFDELTWAEVPVFRALMAVRGLVGGGVRGDDRVYDWFVSSGFAEPIRTSDEILVVSTPPAIPRAAADPPPQSVEAFRAFDKPGCIKIAVVFRAGDGHLATETRVHATDDRARRVFSAYWLLIRPWSGLIRHVWLRAIRARAKRSYDRSP